MSQTREANDGDTDAPLTPIQQNLMAYVDDEMSPQERVEFEKQLSESSELAAEIAEFQCLTDITKSMTLTEPTDHEMRRFWESFYNRSEWQLGWILLISGVAVLAAVGLYELLRTDISWIFKAGAVCTLVGGGTLFFNTLRLKMRTTRFDRYRGVMR